MPLDSQITTDFGEPTDGYEIPFNQVGPLLPQQHRTVPLSGTIEGSHVSGSITQHSTQHP